MYPIGIDIYCKRLSDLTVGVLLRQGFPVLHLPLDLDAGLAAAGLLHQLHAVLHLEQELRPADLPQLEPRPGQVHGTGAQVLQ